MEKITSKTLDLIKKAIEEDAPQGDITAMLFVPSDLSKKASIITKEEGVFFGEEIISGVFQVVDPDVEINFFVKDGQWISKKDKICDLSGKSRSILLAERVMLNFLQRLCGVATTTAKFVRTLDDSTIKVLDTRKTTPLFRSLEKAAVLAGGGYSHRFGLSDMILIKENHLKQLEYANKLVDLGEIIRGFKELNPNIKIEIEVENLEQLSSFDLALVNYIMLDNFKISDIKLAKDICRKRSFKAELEVSGNVTLENINQYKNSGIDRISVGSLTHSVKSLDLSLLFY